MKWLGFRVPFAIVNQANSANQLYPHAVSLMESIRTYELTCQKVIYVREERTEREEEREREKREGRGVALGLACTLYIHPLYPFSRLMTMLEFLHWLPP